MSAVGSLVFCTDCGNLLDSSTGNKNTILVCDCCGAENKGKYENWLQPSSKCSSSDRYRFQNNYNYN